MLALPLVAVTGLTLLGLTRASTIDDSNATTTASTTTVTATSLITYTLTLVRAAASSLSSADHSHTSLVPYETMSEGKKYTLQGCFAQSEPQHIGLLLGQNYTAHDGDSMSLSLCLKICASAVVAGSLGTYPFVGVAGGE